MLLSSEYCCWNSFKKCGQVCLFDYFMWKFFSRKKIHMLLIKTAVGTGSEAIFKKIYPLQCMRVK